MLCFNAIAYIMLCFSTTAYITHLGQKDFEVTSASIDPRCSHLVASYDTQGKRWAYSSPSPQGVNMSIMKFLICTILPPGASKLDQTPKFDDFVNLIQVFPKTP